MSEQASHPEEFKGLFYASGAYVLWGVLPVYWRFLSDVPPFELTIHRSLWCAVVVAAITAARGRLATIGAILRTPKTLATLFLTSLLISTNWGIYMYAIATEQLVEGALGYYINPLLSFILGVAFFGERLSPLRWIAVGLAAAGVAVKIVAFGHLPLISLGLALTFGFYGYFRKRVAVASIDGLLVETGLVFPITAGLVGWWFARGEGVLFSGPVSRDALLMFGGALSALPLGLFAAGVRRMRLTTLGFLQYLSPTITLLLAVFGFHEPFAQTDFLTFGLVWLAIVVVALEGRFRKASAA